MNTPLWQQINTLRFESADIRLTFVQRLARENAWPLNYTERVITEYRRFIYLIATTGVAHTPSDEVDQAWHLHLSYTRSYWQGLCRDILGFDLHHCPTEGGPAEEARFRQQYASTLATYQKTFGEAPPQDIWPPVSQRFRHAARFVRVNRAKNWIIGKPTHPGKLAAAAFLPLTLSSCTMELADKGFLFWIKVVIGIAAVYYLIKFLRWLGWRGGNGCGSACGGCGGD